MIKARKGALTIGCLMIDEPMSGGKSLAGLYDFLKARGVKTAGFEWGQPDKLYDRLQAAFEKVYSGCDVSGIIAGGSGCAAALAIAAQLQVDRLILINPRRHADKENPSLTRSLNRLHAFARRNAFFCVADVLIADSGQKRYAAEIEDSLVQCRISGMRLCVRDDKKICTNNESVFKTEIYRFLRAGELAKSLAENSEMCIIYE